MSGAICGPSRGRYGYPWRITGPMGIRQWVSEHYKPIKPPRTVSCEHPRHCGRRRRFPLEECFVQHWEMAEKELKQAIDDWDMMSLDMPKRILCPSCCRQEQVK